MRACVFNFAKQIEVDPAYLKLVDGQVPIMSELAGKILLVMTGLRSDTRLALQKDYGQ